MPDRAGRSPVLAELMGRASAPAEPMGGRLESVSVDIEDPSHVVVYLTWKAQDVRKVEEEACTAAWAPS